MLKNQVKVICAVKQYSENIKYMENSFTVRITNVSKIYSRLLIRYEQSHFKTQQLHNQTPPIIPSKKGVKERIRPVPSPRCPSAILLSNATHCCDWRQQHPF